MVELTFEGLKNHVFLDWILFMSPKDVLLLSCTCHSLKEVLDNDLNVWEHCLSIKPLFIKANRMTLPRIQRNRHCLVWHLYIWQKIENATNFIYLLCNMDSYSFLSGLVRSSFKKIQELSFDEVMRHTAHKLQLHVMISQHLLQTNIEDVEEVILGLNALKVLSRPFHDIIVTQDVFTTAPPSLISSLILRAIYSYQDNHRVIEAAFNACTNLAFHRNHATYFITEGFIDQFTILVYSECLNSRNILLAGLNCLKNIYDPLALNIENLEAIMKVAILITKTRSDDTIIVAEYIGYLSQIAVWQAPHMRLQELFELLTGLISQSNPRVEETVGLDSHRNMEQNDINVQLKAKTLLDQIFLIPP